MVRIAHFNAQYLWNYFMIHSICVLLNKTVCHLIKDSLKANMAREMFRIAYASVQPDQSLCCLLKAFMNLPHLWQHTDFTAIISGSILTSMHSSLAAY